MLVVVSLVGRQDVPRVGFSQDEDMVEDLVPDAADDPFAGAFIRRTCGALLSTVQFLGLEDGTEGTAVLAVTVTQQEAQGLHAHD